MQSKGVALNPATRWRCIDVPGVAHEANLMAQAARGLLLESLVDVPENPQPAPRRAMLRVSPNPIAGSGSLSGEGWGTDPVRIEVYDLAGRRVAARTTPVMDGTWGLDWSGLLGGRSLPKGIYLVRA